MPICMASKRSVKDSVRFPIGRLFEPAVVVHCFENTPPNGGSQVAPAIIGSEAHIDLGVLTMGGDKAQRPANGAPPAIIETDNPTHRQQLIDVEKIQQHIVKR